MKEEKKTLFNILKYFVVIFRQENYQLFITSIFKLIPKFKSKQQTTKNINWVALEISALLSICLKASQYLPQNFL